MKDFPKYIKYINFNWTNYLIHSNYGVYNVVLMLHDGEEVHPDLHGKKYGNIISLKKSEKEYPGKCFVIPLTEEEYYIEVSQYVF